MSTYILIHGSWHGGWCWDKVVPLLEKEGHKVEAPDLPGHGNDKTPLNEITLEAYTNRLTAILDAQSEAVILVGHSMGGAVISQTAESRPDKIKKLIYISAFLLENGESTFQYSLLDRDALLLPNLILSEDQSYVTVREDALKDVFYGDCSDEDVVRAKTLLGLEATAPCMTPIHTTPGNFGRIPRFYISCSRDRAITPEMQKQMCENLPCERVIQMDTSHSPFFSAPDELADHLLSL